jgi:diketogulonate reductase-like aldo/keto reductase
MPTAPLIAANGAHIPAIGLGTWPLKGDTCEQAVQVALAAGYRHIDTAAMYGNEAEVGRGIRASAVPREDVWVTTKVWWENLSERALRISAEASLKALGLSYVDLLLIHWPNPAIPLSESMRALCKVKRDGLTRNIGISNFPTRLMDEAVALSSEPIVTNQVEYHPHLDQSRVLAAARRHGMTITAYCPLGRGSIGGVLDEPVVVDIARSKGRTPGEIVMRWHMQQPGVIAVPKSATPGRIRANIDVFSLTLSEAEMARISALARPNGRVVNLAFAPQWD